MPYRFALLSLLISLFVYQASAQILPEQEILKSLGADRLERFQGQEYFYKLRSKKTKKWGVYELAAYGEKEFNSNVVIPYSFDEINEWFDEMIPFVVVKNNGKYGLLLNPFEITFDLANIKFKYEAIERIENNGDYFAVAKLNGKWGLLDWFEGFELTDFKYPTKEAVPLLSVQSWQIPMLLAAREQLKTDIIEFDLGNGDGVFKAQHPETGKWGMYQMMMEDELIQLIPMEYDSIKFFGFNGLFTEVYNGGKLGIYTSYFSFGSDARQTVPCAYDGSKTYTVEGKYGTYLALKKGDFWGWVDWVSGEEKSEFKYRLKGDLPYPDYQSEY